MLINLFTNIFVSILSGFTAFCGKLLHRVYVSVFDFKKTCMCPEEVCENNEVVDGKSTHSPEDNSIVSIKMRCVLGFYHFNFLSNC